jgi:hypothetical protein
VELVKNSVPPADQPKRSDFGALTVAERAVSKLIVADSARGDADAVGRR